MKKPIPYLFQFPNGSIKRLEPLYIVAKKNGVSIP